MRGVVIEQGRFRLRSDLPEPVAGYGEVMVRVAAAGLNAADIQQARGDYPAPPGWPADVPGLEFAGVVEVVGAGVDGVDVGVRVMALVGGGAHAQRLAVPADTVLAIPEGMDFVNAAGFPEAFCTAWDGLVDQAGVGPGDRVLVTGAAGGVGTAMVQLAALCGARVVASARNHECHDGLRQLVSGVEVVIPDQEGDHGPYDVIVELVGGPSCLDRIDWLAPYGRILVIGVQAGATVPIRLFDLMARRGRIIASTIRARPPHEKTQLASLARTKLLPKFTAGALTCVIDSTFPLDDALAAYDRLAGPGKFGKVILDLS